ncbi:hypothetical protein HY440_01840, partial [Candidatus Microgenomates bacterium]|nr:hypothetical protein [Candidatus Microgenomates bacterium]
MRSRQETHEKFQIRTLRLATEYLNDTRLQAAFRWATTPRATDGKEPALEEIAILKTATERTNDIIRRSEEIDCAFTNISDARYLLEKYGRHFLPVPFVQVPSELAKWRYDFLQTLQTGNLEIRPAGPVYTEPTGDPEKDFHWFLNDGFARQVAIHLGIPNRDHRQEHAADTFCCAICEGMLDLAEEENEDAIRQIQWMIKDRFIAPN